MDVISKLEGLVKGQPFINDDFMLTNDFARELYHESAEKMPIIDYHCHLVPEMIASNHQFKDLTEVWLGGDHYKWRAMRATECLRSTSQDLAAAMRNSRSGQRLCLTQ